MKTRLLFTLLTFSYISIFSQTTYVPDDNFEQALIDLGYDDVLDDYVVTNNINQLTVLDISNLNITDLTGIEDFVLLKWLTVNNAESTNKINSIDLTQNTKLQELNLSGNNLKNIDLTQNTKLDYLDLSHNLIEQNINLNTLENLFSLSLNNNKLTSISLPNNSKYIEAINLSYNQLESIEFNNLKPIFISLENNNLKSLDISLFSEAIIDLNVKNNTDLQCVQIDEKGNNYSSPWEKDNTTVFSKDCANFVYTDTDNDGIEDSEDWCLNTPEGEEIDAYGCSLSQLTYIPSYNFRYALNRGVHIDLLNYTYRPTHYLESIKSLNIDSDIDVENFTGLEAMINLENIFLYQTPDLEMINFDLSKNTKLKSISIYESSIETLDLSNHLNLTSLDLSDTKLTSIDISKNILLNTVYTYNNELECIQVNNEQLAEINAGNYWQINPNTTISTNCSVPQDLTYVPDNNFEQALINLGYDDVLDDYVSTNTLESITELEISETYITDFTGLEAFTNIERLTLRMDATTSHNVESIDLSQNLKLSYLYLSSLQGLINIDISHLHLLTEIYTYNFELQELNTSNNNLLEKIGVSYNSISNLDVSNNSKLTHLIIGANSVKNIDLSSNENLENLSIFTNPLESIDLKNNIKLETLSLVYNEIKEIDLKQNKNIVDLSLRGNNLDSLDISALTNLNNLNVKQNKSLVCIQVNNSQDYSAWIKEDNASFSTDCSTPQDLTYVPDDNFEQALIDLGYDDVLDDYVVTDNINNVLELNFQGKGIEGLTGIEDFSALKDLNLQRNLLTIIDLSDLINLKSLTLTGNHSLENIDVSKNINLESLNIIETSLKEIDVSQNVKLKELGLADNSRLTTINVTQNLKLETLVVNNTNISEINLSNNLLLKTFLARYTNNLKTCNIQNGTNESLTTLDLRNTPNLNCIQVDDIELANNYRFWSKDDIARFSTDCSAPQDLTYVPDDNFEQALIDLGYDDVLDDYVFTSNIEGTSELDLSGFNITDLTGLEDFSSLLELSIVSESSDSKISTIDLTKNLNLIRLDLSGNTITDLDISQNLKLIDLNVSTNQLTNLDLSKNVLLESLDFSANQIEAINLSNNTKLTSLAIASVPISELDISSNTNLEEMVVSFTGLKSLDVSNNIKLTSLTINGSFLTNLDLSGLKELTSFTSFINFDLHCIKIDATQDYSNWRKDDATTFSTNCTAPQDLTYVPDDNFEQALIDLGYDDVLDDYVVTGNINNIKKLAIYGSATITKPGIKDFTGLEDFNALESFICDGHSMTELNITPLTNLKEFTSAFNSKLEYLEVSNNLKLEKLDIADNYKISEIDLSQNINLTNLVIVGTDINELNLTKNDSLKSIEFITFSNNTNQLSQLDLSQNLLLENIFLNNTKIETLDISQKPLLTTVYLTNNLNLSCIQIDATQDYSNWKKDETATFSTNCTASQDLTYVPDDNFEQALIDLGYDDVLDDYVITANLLEIIILNLSSLNITDFTGLEAISNLDWLKIDNRSTELYAIEHIDVSFNTKLRTLVLAGNNLKAIDLSKNERLTGLNLNNNQLETINLSNNLSLSSLYIDDNKLKELDLSKNKKLILYSLQNNELTSLNLKNGNNHNFAESVELKGNPDLVCIQVDNSQFSTENQYWRKDDTATFSTDCSAPDSDNDGVQDELDACPDTPEGETVTPNGCSISQIADLAVQNIGVTIGSVPCADTFQGNVGIEVLKNVAIHVIITQNNTNVVFDGEVSQLSPLTLNNLTEGDYTICASSPKIPGYEQCFYVSSSATQNTLETSIYVVNPYNYSMKVSGSNSYVVKVNNNTSVYNFDTTDEQTITIPIVPGINAISINGLISCENQTIADSTLELYPTITSGNITITNSSKDAIAGITVTDMSGKTTDQIIVNDTSEELNIDLHGCSTGLHFISIQMQSGEIIQHKIIIR